MAITPFRIAAPRHATYTVGLEPAYNALMSLSLLSDRAQDIEVEDWISETAAALTTEQRYRTRLIFEGLGAALLIGADYPDFPAYLEALRATAPANLRDRVLQPLLRPGPDGSLPDPSRLLADPPAFLAQAAWLTPEGTVDEALLLEAHRLLNDPPSLRQLIVAHLRELWEHELADEWTRRLPNLTGLVTYVHMRPISPGTAADTIRAFIGRELPDHISVQLDGVRHIIFVLSPHIRLHAARFGSADTIWVFALGQFWSLPVRQEPIKRAEVIRPLQALADDSRLHILELLARHKDLPTQEIIAQLDQSQPNVSRHLKQLASVGLVAEQRGESGKRFQLVPKQIDAVFWKLKQLVSPENIRAAEPDVRADLPRELRGFLDRNGRITTFPAKRPAQALVLTYLASKFATDREYTEKEINEVIKQWHTYEDHTTLRRALYDAQLLDRTANGARYWRVNEDQPS